MSYELGLSESNTTYPNSSDIYPQVKTAPDYTTLGNYYSRPQCPLKSAPGECLVRPVYITPGFGGTGYNIPGFNTNISDLPLSDSNYFNINNAYPQYCKTPCLSPSYG
ncbi:hypothetical protein EBZ80_02160 [bacterium]|nr:hypothetical protein [bacterium]